MTDFPAISEQTRLARLQPPAQKLRIVLDTDTYNEIDDQFALAYAWKSPDRIDLEAIYAAPFHNKRSSGPEDGMEKSYEEILRLLEFLGDTHEPAGFVYKGSRNYLVDEVTAQASPAARDLVERALASPDDDPLHVVAIGAITNVASAILMEPKIIERIVVVWLGGNALYWPTAREFNLQQDVAAARVVFDSGVPLVQVPCMGVTTHLLTTLAELDQFVRGHSIVGDYLYSIVESYSDDHYAWSKVIWDVAPIAYFVNPAWTPSDLVHSPILTDQMTWSVDESRHFIRTVNFVHRDPIFRDLFSKLRDLSSG